MRISDDLTCVIDRSQVTYFVLLDYSKASDLINYELLLVKLHYYKVSDRLLNWFKCNLSNRSQIVKVDNLFSSELQVSCGIPQGSIWDPYCLLFSRHIFHQYFPPTVGSMFTKMTQKFISLVTRYNEAVTELNENLSYVANWSSDNGLIILIL